MGDDVGDNHIHSWRDLRKGNWPMLNFLNVEMNKANEMRRLTELNTSSSMESFRIYSAKENQDIYDYIFSGKLKVSRPAHLSEAFVTQKSEAKL